MPKHRVTVEVEDRKVFFESKKNFTNYMKRRLDLIDLDEKHVSGFTHREIIKNFMLEKLPLLRKKVFPGGNPRVLYYYPSKEINLMRNARFGIVETNNGRFFSFTSEDIFNLNRTVTGKDGKLYRGGIHTFSPIGMMKAMYYKAEEPEERMSFSEFQETDEWKEILEFHRNQARAATERRSV